MILFIILAGVSATAIFLLPFIIYDEIKKHRKYPEIAPEKEKDGDGVRQIIWGAYSSLKKQGGAGYGPWLSCILSRDGAPVEIALTALHKTREELIGSRFDLSGLDRAIDALEMGAGK